MDGGTESSEMSCLEIHSEENGGQKPDETTTLIPTKEYCMVCRTHTGVRTASDLQPGDHIEIPMDFPKCYYKHHAIVEEIKEDEGYGNGKANIKVIDLSRPTQPDCNSKCVEHCDPSRNFTKREEECNDCCPRCCNDKANDGTFSITSHYLQDKEVSDLALIQRIDYKRRRNSLTKTLQLSQKYVDHFKTNGTNGDFDYDLCVRNCEHFAVAMATCEKLEPCDESITKWGKCRGFVVALLRIFLYLCLWKCCLCSCKCGSCSCKCGLCSCKCGEVTNQIKKMKSFCSCNSNLKWVSLGDVSCLQSARCFWWTFHIFMSIVQLFGYIVNFMLFAEYARGNHAYDKCVFQFITGMSNWCYEGNSIRGFETFCDWIFLGIIVVVYIFGYRILLSCQKGKDICRQCKHTSRIVYGAKLCFAILVELVNIFLEKILYDLVDVKAVSCVNTIILIVLLSLIELFFMFFLVPHLVAQCIIRMCASKSCVRCSRHCYHSCCCYSCSFCRSCSRNCSGKCCSRFRKVLSFILYCLLTLCCCSCFCLDKCCCKSCYQNTSWLRDKCSPIYDLGICLHDICCCSFSIEDMGCCPCYFDADAYRHVRHYA